MAQEEQSEVGGLHQSVQGEKPCIVCGKPARSKGAKFCLNCFVGSKPASVAYAVSRAVRRGELKPVRECVCVDCGAPARHYDHRDYNKPTEVEPVCVPCNVRRPPAIRYGKNADGSLAPNPASVSTASRAARPAKNRSGDRHKDKARRREYMRAWMSAKRNASL